MKGVIQFGNSTDIINSISFNNVDKLISARGLPPVNHLQISKNNVINIDFFSLTKELKYQPLCKENQAFFEKSKILNNTFKKKFEDSTYYGQMEDNMRSGFGIMKYDNGRTYEGNWNKDLRNGFGFEIFPNANSYKGDYQNGKAHGKGIYKWYNGETYDGDWVEGYKEGKGHWKGKNCENYSGDWKRSQPDGIGLFICGNGGIYKGEWQKGLKHGFGHEQFVSGDIYIGNYKEGSPDGIGKYIWKDQSTYIGNFKNGKKNGFGKWKSKFSSKGKINNKLIYYEGSYFNDKKSGFGKLRVENDYEYIGQFLNDEKSGIGEILWNNGNFYIGQFLNDVQQGFGRLKESDNIIKEGIFQNNKLITQYNNKYRNNSFKKDLVLDKGDKTILNANKKEYDLLEEKLNGNITNRIIEDKKLTNEDTDKKFEKLRKFKIKILERSKLTERPVKQNNITNQNNFLLNNCSTTHENNYQKENNTSINSISRIETKIPECLLTNDFNIKTIFPDNFKRILLEFKASKERLNSKIRKVKIHANQKEVNSHISFKSNQNEINNLNNTQSSSLFNKYGMIKNILNKKVINKFFHFKRKVFVSNSVLLANTGSTIMKEKRGLSIQSLSANNTKYSTFYSSSSKNLNCNQNLTNEKEKSNLKRGSMFGSFMKQQNIIEK